MRLLSNSFIVILLIIALTLGAFPAMAQDELTETYGSPTGDGLIVNYPTGWIVEELIPNEAIILATSRSALDAQYADETIPAREMVLFLYGPALLHRFVDENLETNDLATAHAILIRAFNQESHDVMYGATESILIAQHPAVTMQFAHEENEGISFLVDFEGAYVFVSIKVARGTIAEHKLIALTVFQTLRYTPIETATPSLDDLTESYTFPDSALTVNYPADWVTLEHPGGEFVITNNQELVDVLMQFPVDEQAFSSLLVQNALISLLEPVVVNRFYPDIASTNSMIVALKHITEVEGWGLTTIETMMLAGQPALAATTPAGMIVLIKFDAGYVVVIAYDGIGQYTDHILAILDTLTFTAAD